MMVSPGHTCVAYAKASTLSFAWLGDVTTLNHKRKEKRP